jgi:hypothetical protein
MRPVELAIEFPVKVAGQFDKAIRGKNYRRVRLNNTSVR